MKINQNRQTSHVTTTAKKDDIGIGTVIGVGLVGVVIVVSYITLYALYMARV